MTLTQVPQCCAGSGWRVLLICALFLAQPLEAAESVLIEFELQDQFGNKHSHSGLAGSVVLVIGSDKDGSVHNEAWGTAIHQSVADHPNYARLRNLPLADLRGVPFFAKGFVRGMMPEDPADWVLMDWKGMFPRSYAFEQALTNVLVFATDGALLLHASGAEPGDEDVDRVATQVRAALDAIGDLRQVQQTDAGPGG